MKHYSISLVYNNLLAKLFLDQIKDIVLLEEQTSKRLGLGVTINDSKDVGSVVVNFKNLHELNFILKKLSSESKQQEKLDSVNLKEEQL